MRTRQDTLMPERESNLGVKTPTEVLSSIGKYSTFNDQITNYEEEIASLKSCLNEAKNISQKIESLRKYIHEEGSMIATIEDAQQRAWEFAGLRASEGRIEELEEELIALLK
jgi:uncharacterized protein YlxW (UPF0749 family)